MSSAAAVPAGANGAAGPRLRRNAVGLTGAVIMSAAIMGPAVSTFFNPQFSTPFSGEATPFVYLACLIAILIAASGIVEMAREFPSAGAFYTYVTRGPRPARRLRHRRADVRRLRAAAAGRGRADRLVPAEHVPRRVRT